MTTFKYIDQRITRHHLPLYLGIEKSTCDYWSQKPAGLLEWTDTPSTETKIANNYESADKKVQTNLAITAMTQTSNTNSNK